MEAVADGVFLLRRELGHGLTRRVIGQEERVVAKPVRAALGMAHHALTGTLAHGDETVGLDEGNRAHEARCARGILNPI